MEIKELVEKLNETKTALEAKAKADATQAAKDEVALQMKAINEKLEALNTLPTDLKAEDLKKAVEDVKALTEGFDALQLKMKQGGGNFKGFKTFGSELGEKLTEKAAELKNFKVSKKGFGAIELESKAVGNMASATSLTGSYFVPPTVVPGIDMRPFEQLHMRDLLPTGITNSNVVRYIRDNGGEGGPAMVAEGGTKPQIDRDLQIYDANVRKIATYFRVPEEMIDDIPYLQSFLSQVGIQEVMVIEDTQVLYGDGTGQNLSGIYTNATAFSAGTSVVAAPNNFDVLLAARKQARVAKYNPNIALVSPVDFYDMIEKKDATNNYLFLGGGNGLDVPGVLTMRTGLRVVEHTSVTAGDFLVFDPSKAAIFDRLGTTVRFYDQDQDNAIKNLITIVIEKRLALPIYQPAAFIKGRFDTAITDLTS